MTYYITIKGRDKTNLFLINRVENKDDWWTGQLRFAEVFTKETEGFYRAKKLSFKSARLVDEHEAIRLEKENRK